MRFAVPDPVSYAVPDMETVPGVRETLLSAQYGGMAVTNPADFPTPLVGTAWLADRLKDPDLRVVDVRWRARFENDRGISTDDHDGYLEGHIPGAVFLAMRRDLSDPDNPVPDMLPPPGQFARVMEGIGVGDDSLVVVYDNSGFSLGADRLWWALSYYGHERVAVLDGGLREWRREGRPLETAAPAIAPATFHPKPHPDWIATKEEVKAAMADPGSAIVDCLGADMYSGRDSHPWGARPGHIPGAVNVPFYANIDPALMDLTMAERERLIAADQPLTFASRETLEKLYADAGIEPDSDVITYCGVGFAASCGLLALRLLGHPKARLYDGSWAEWSADPALPVETG